MPLVDPFSLFTRWQLAAGGAVLGLLIGSFVATLVLRWPAGRSVVTGRSACDGCGRVLAPAELVPLLSFVLLKGRCGTCSQPIDPRHPALELAAAGIGGAALWIYPGAAGFAGALFGWMLLALAVLDAEHFWLPDALTWPLAGAGLLAGLAFRPALADRLVGLALGYLSLWLVAWCYRQLRGRQGLGGGDPKLLGAIGAWLGWAALPFVLVGASLIGLMLVGWRAARGQTVAADLKLPFGTLMAIAAWTIWLAAPICLPWILLVPASEID